MVWEGVGHLGQLSFENMQVVLGLEGWGIWDNVANLVFIHFRRDPPPSLPLDPPMHLSNLYQSYLCKM